MVFRVSFTILAGFVLLTACRDPLQSKEKVQAAVVERLQAHSGLDLKDLDVTTTDVQFERNKATATVAFHPKGDTSVNSGMTMKYNLEERDGKWVVTGVNSPSGSSFGAHPSDGVPPAGGPATGAGDGALRPGHPSIPDAPKLPDTPKQ
jgi:hypothetical protein